MSLPLRPVLAAACVAALAVTAGAAAAAPKAPPVCNLVKDDTEDAEIVSAQKGLDIVTADLASDGKNLTAVIRLAGPPAGGNPEAVGGTRYYFSFSAPGSANAQYLSASIPFVGAATYATGEITANGAGESYTPDDAAASGSIKGNVMTISAPVAALTRIKAAPGSKLTGLTVETFGVVGVLLTPVDDAAGKSYVVGTSSCVKPGAV